MNPESPSTEINSKMATNREEVSELVKQSETLTKIRFLFELALGVTFFVGVGFDFTFF